MGQRTGPSGAGLALSLVVVVCCTQSGEVQRAQAAQPVHGVNVAFQDTTCAPCRAFYEYANGGWIRGARTSNSRPAIGALDEMQRRSADVVHAILDSLAKADLPQESVGWKVGHFYASCLDSSRAEREGLAPVGGELARIGSIASRADLRDEAARLNRAGIGVLFTFAAAPDPTQSTVVIGDLSPGGLSLPSWEYYVNGDKETVRVRATYRSTVESLLGLARVGAGRVRGDAMQALEIETRLARASHDATTDVTSARDPATSNHKLTIRELTGLTPHWSWPAYFATLGVPASSPGLTAINVQDPHYFRIFDRMVSEVPLPVWRSYLRVQYLESAAPELSSPFAQAYARTVIALGGAPPAAERWRSCVAETDRHLGNAVGSEYVRRAFTPAARTRILEMGRNIEGVLRQDLDTLSWMSGATRREAVAKLDQFVVKIGYPERWPDYSALTVRDTSFWSNIEAANQFATGRQLATLGQPIDRQDLQYTPQTVDAYFNPRRNELGFAAGYLQPPFFDSLADAASNYGGIGVVIGHELTHAFDQQGRRYDASGNLRDWWVPVDDSSFRQRAASLARQYDGYTVIDSLRINGGQTLSENLADLGGAVLAYRALQHEIAGTSQPLIGGMTPDQRFFLAFAQSRRGAFTPEYLRNKVLTNNHSPDKWRVLGPIVNMPEFARAFHCQPDDPMVRPDSVRVRIW